MAFEFAFFRRISQSQWQTCTLYVICVLCAIGTVIVSLFQIRSKTKFCPDGVVCPTTENVCKSPIIRLISPFSFLLSNDIHIECGWPPNNTTLRIISCASFMFSSIIMVIVVIRNKITSEAVFSIQLLKYVFIISLILIYCILVLDCYGLKNGHKACKENFVLPDNTALLSFYYYIDASFFNVNIANPTIKSCRLTPYLYIVFLDIGNVILGSFSILLTVFCHENAAMELAKKTNNSVENAKPVNNTVNTYNTVNSVNNTNTTTNTVNGNGTTYTTTTVQNTATTAPVSSPNETAALPANTTDGPGLDTTNNDDDPNPFELDDDDDDENPFGQ